ncbi:MAG: bifunctional phosphoribosylaminoimidazolecarboxamide formyltransferase/IMP cyclohydrolase [Pirellulales bacterium]|nr:bifunctional phosphoribosylaminoimidazolecarboxamide formyltransferase/IMP cyclohydrolase [Pirellulales bacterium]
MNSPKVERALISVSDKSGLVEFAQGLVTAGVAIFASGGSRKHLEAAGVPVREVAAYTGFPEMMDGRIKTLHPKIHGGILCRRDRPDDMEALQSQGIVPFELVVVNLYPFQQTVSRPNVPIAEAIEKIDIGGPTLIRAAAKNHEFVCVATAPFQYERVLEQVRSTGSTTPELRRDLALAAFVHTAEYDAAISGYLSTLKFTENQGTITPQLAESIRGALGSQGIDVAEVVERSVQKTRDDWSAGCVLSILLRRAQLRYGENPHQLAALYAFPDAGTETLVHAEQLHGKELSYNNYLDLDSALAMVRSLPIPSVVVIKHNNPCGAATADTVVDALRRAWEGDPLSAFGSVLGFNETVDAEAAEFLAEPDRFVEAIIAPEFTPEAVEILTTKPKWKANVRLLSLPHMLLHESGQREYRQISGGMLCQTADNLRDDDSQWRVVTEAQPSTQQQIDLRLAWAVCRHVKSNAIVLAKDLMVVGVGAGQMSRVDSVEIAIEKAGERTRGAVLASDAFFPFDDSIHRAAEAGVAAVIQPGGSRRDEEVIAACNRHGIPMIFTGHRHFRH